MRKGQAAMEFLMTYGWAILVVLAAIGALAYFGVLDTASLLPERCAFPSGMDCVGKASVAADSNTVSVVLTNNNGASINITGYEDVTGDDCTTSGIAACAGAGCTLAAVPVTIANNEKVTIRFNCSNGITAGRFKGEMQVLYKNLENGLPNKALGSIAGKAS